VKTRSWFRVLVDRSGKVVDCKPVSGAGDAEGGVFYFRALSAKDAGQLASNEHARLTLAARRARYRAEGLCRCGGPRENKTLARCKRCTERQAVHCERRAAKERGETVPPLDRRVVLQEKRDATADAVRLSTLEDVQRAWLRNSTVGGFSAWLVDEIKKLAKKTEAA
jgi:hypothetical protein